MKIKTILSYFCIFVCTILFRIFFIELYSIPSGSMENTLVSGDKVLVNKLAYGPKLPASPYNIPWINLIWYLTAKANTNPDSTYWNYHRLRDFYKINYRDVMVFIHPLWGGRHNFLSNGVLPSRAIH